MKDTLSTKILHRESSDHAVKNRFYRRLYSDRSLISNLDIVNELDGHSGCVNALSWSKSGELLASGSDDQHLNIHRYQPVDADKQFKLETTIATGHTHNIFSVRFMPHSQDRTVITAAGDGEVRIFDLEYSGLAKTASSAASIASEGRRRGRSSVYNGVRYLSDGDTNCRVYRSHGDRVKRIVTESSPHLFLTCSEDGEVRQWDLRQPSSAYPSPRGGRNGSAGNVPPPLISYKRYNLDLNSISCSASQPHYIALGGAHLHALLHDRRMAGRDRLEESGTPLSSSSTRSEHEETMMGDATKCVRKFAPRGQSKMRRSDNGHITALKISDARPDEMIVSWSGDHIYSFDLVRNPGAGEEDTIRPLRPDAADRKRKRRANGSESSTGQPAAAARAASRLRTGDQGETSGDASLRIRYQNGQQEEFRLPTQQQSQHSRSIARMTTRQRSAQRIGKATVEIRSSLFGATSGDPDSISAFTSALGQAASWLSNMDEIIQEWGYPMDPSPQQVSNHRTLRRNRESSRRFMQASGVIARVLGGKLQTPSGSLSPLMEQFTSIQAKRNDLELSRREQFGYDFLKAITLWLDSGLGNLINGFTRQSDMSPHDRAAKRLPIPESDATPEAIQDILIPYLMQLATDQPVVDPTVNRFQTDAGRVLFSSEITAVRAFAAVIQIPFADLSDAATSESADGVQVQDRRTAWRYWALKVARGVLLNAAQGVNFAFVDRAFGGLGRVVKDIAREEAALAPVSDSEDDAVQDIAMLRGPPSTGGSSTGAGDTDPSIEEMDEEMMDILSAEEAAELMAEAEDESEAYVQDTTLGSDEDHEDNDGDGNDDNDDDHEQSDSESEDDDDSASASEEDDVPNTGLPRFMYQSAFSRRHQRSKVAQNIPCSSATRTYRGHCNVKTVKDVNFFGLNDEYVVSGSDDGNFFIWDRDTSQLVNVLQGDGEVVNVVQGHPYESMLAVSGIDHTIKIFSPDGRAREAARLGRGVEAHDATDFSSLAWPSRIGRRASRRSGTSEPTVPPPPAAAAVEEDEGENDDFVAPTGLASRRRIHESYQITQQNDVDRQGGNQDSFVTRSMLAQLAVRLRAARAARFAAVAGAGREPGEEEGRIARVVQGDDCCVM